MEETLNRMILMKLGLALALETSNLKIWCLISKAKSGNFILDRAIVG